ncbi:carbohydrate-binding module family 20 domain-containing protein [Cellulomonas sp. HZM]|uniref:carbohydrate-binding module family 20 domain-containing protein n=1 Tax=Cellulomonas sp. HZM TaxID=1454010 RepID=UPI00055539A5|nr:carbohydrate-binding module family 20 domain-containing protein [Cellulomonas sp. HZM]
MRTTAPQRWARRLTALSLSAVLAVGALVALQGNDTASASAPKTAKGDAILNLFQWTWPAVASECTSTIGPEGFAYVQVSPPQESIQGTQWWTSYQPVSYKLDSKLGNRAQFADMVATCKAAGVGVIVDAVINHMAGVGRTGTGTGGSSFGDDSFPAVPYGYGDFNDCRTNISNYGDRYQVQSCRLVGLQDLRTGSDYVRDKIAGYLNDLIGLGVAGFRIDAAKHIPASDLVAIKQRLSNPGIYWVQEVIGASGEPIQPSEYLGTGDSHEFSYARTLKSRFDGNIADLKNVANGLLPSANAGVFVDNHDTERNGETMSYKWGAKYKLANTFMLSYPYGSPAVYSGYTFTDTDAGAPGASATSVPAADCSSSAWTCVQRWTETRGMVAFHNTVGDAALTNWYDDGANLVAYGRGAKGYVVINNASNAVTRTYTTSLPDGTYCDVVAASDCSRTVAVRGGTFSATVPAYGALALHVGALSGTTSTPTPTTTAGTSTTVYYSTAAGWGAYKIHYKVGSGSWTTVPGEAMTAACTGWVSKQVASGGSTVTAAFNDGNGTWDNNGGKDYALSGSVVAVKGGAVTTSDPCGTTSTPTPTPTATPTSTTAALAFSVTATTSWGQNLFVVGDVAALGAWDTSKAVALSSAAYPVWRASVQLPAGTAVQYKYVRKDATGAVTWESGANRTATVPASGTLSLADTWRG